MDAVFMFMCKLFLRSSNAFVMLCDANDQICVLLKTDNSIIMDVFIHYAHLFQIFLTKCNIPVVLQTPCSPDMESSDFILFLKQAENVAYRNQVWNQRRYCQKRDEPAQLNSKLCFRGVSNRGVTTGRSVLTLNDSTLKAINVFYLFAI